VLYSSTVNRNSRETEIHPTQKTVRSGCIRRNFWSPGVATEHGLPTSISHPYNVKTTSSVGQAMLIDANRLESYNSGGLTPGCTP